MTRAFWILLRREISALASSPVTYAMLLMMALFMFFVVMGAAVNLEQAAHLNLLQLIFRSLPIWFPLLIIAPLLTMGLLADEFKSGTIEMLMTAPVTDLDVVLSKFCAALLFFLALMAPAVIDILAFQWITQSAVPIPAAQHLLTYLMLLLYGMFFCSIGLYVSSLTRSQMMAAFLSLIGILFVFFIGLLRYRTTDPFWESLLDYILIIQHMIIFSEGVLDTRPLVFYLSGTMLFLALTQRSLAARRLKS
jgi:ABC-2 type transport system permease protein